MYKLYILPGACSRAISALLHELGQEVELINKEHVANYHDLNPSDTVPVLIDKEGNVLREGVAIILHLLEKHHSSMLPQDSEQRSKFMEWLLTANATVHPAYSRLFFIEKNITDPVAKRQAFDAAAEQITKLWSMIDKHLQSSPYMCGDQLSIVDMLLAVYATWGDLFSVNILLGNNVQRMIEHVEKHPAFVAAVEAEAA